MRIDPALKAILARSEALPDQLGGIKLVCEKVRAAIRKGDANEAARFAFMLGGMETGRQTMWAVIKDGMRNFKAREKRAAEVEARRQAILAAYANLTKEELANGRMVAYRRVASELKGTAWECSPSLVRRVLGKDKSAHD